MCVCVCEVQKSLLRWEGEGGGGEEEGGEGRGGEEGEGGRRGRELLDPLDL